MFGQMCLKSKLWVMPEIQTLRYQIQTPFVSKKTKHAKFGFHTILDSMYKSMYANAWVGLKEGWVLNHWAALKCSTSRGRLPQTWERLLSNPVDGMVVISPKQYFWWRKNFFRRSRGCAFDCHKTKGSPLNSLKICLQAESTLDPWSIKQTLSRIS